MPTTSAITDRHQASGFSSLLTSGVVAGFAAGIVFILANMIYATSQGLPAIAPFLAIGTIFFFDDRPMMTLEYALSGVMTHFSLSILFGVIFAMLTPTFRNVTTLIAGAFIYGLLLYVVNFLVFGNLIFEWFAPGDGGPDQIFELIIHPLAYGLVLVPFFVTAVRRSAAGSI
jgi:hypothetical protein